MTNTELATAVAAIVLAVGAKATEHLKARNVEATPEAVENQGRWLIACWQAESYRESCDTSDLAQLFLDGVKPIGSCAEEALGLLDENPLESQAGEFLDWLHWQ